MTCGDDEIELTLGSETDDRLADRLCEVVRKLGGSMTTTLAGVGGSQDLTVVDIDLPKGRLVAIRETYIGLSIRGQRALVEEVRAAMTAI